MQDSLLLCMLEPRTMGQMHFGLRQPFETQCQDWSEVLKRIVATVKFLTCF